MEDVKSKRCLHDGCNTIPSFNTPGETKGIYCADHKKEGMMNLKGKRCQQEGCEKQAHYNTPGESIGVSCSPHKKDGMVNVTCKRCEHDECNKHPSFNTPGETKGIYCADHKKEGMMNLKGKRCHQEGCDKISNYNTPGETKGIYCVAHKKAGMEDVKNTRCKLCPMRVTNKYSGYCYRCYIHKYPDSPILRNHKTKERHVADFVRGAFPEYEFKFDQRVSDGCSKRRPDILLDMGAFVLIIEIDENQHQDYDCSCENKRLMEIFRDCGSRSMAFLRFNPDDYVNSTGKRIASCWGITKDRGLFTVKENKKSEWSTRLNALVDTIKMQLDLEERKDIDVVHLFYDEKNVRTFRNI
jgi:hypothetical protein